jgi:hypothetical protein
LDVGRSAFSRSPVLNFFFARMDRSLRRPDRQLFSPPSVVARWEGEFDAEHARVLERQDETEVDLKEGEVTFADTVRQGD